MAADNEQRLISKIIKDANITTVLERGVSDDWFRVPECKTVFGFLRKYHTDYGHVPSATTVKDNYPNTRLLNVTDSIDYLLDQFLAYRTSRQTYDMLSEAVDIMQDPQRYEDALAVVRRDLAAMDGAIQTGTDLNLSENAENRFAEYQNRASNPNGLIGLPTGFATIDRATAGLQGGQLVTILASGKVGKSTLMLNIATHLHTHGHTVMVQSFEMSNREQQERHDAMRAGISLTRLRSGTLHASEEKKYEAMLKSMDGMQPLMLTDSTQGVTVSALAARVARHDPDIVFVDAVYLMVDEVTGEKGTPQALTSITQSLKNLAQRLDKPIVISTQSLLWKMKGGKTSISSAGYSSSFVQDSDVVLGLDKEEGVDDRRTLKIIASRNCGTAEVQLDWIWETGNFQEQPDGSTAEVPDEDDGAVTDVTDLYGLGQ